MAITDVNQLSELASTALATYAYFESLSQSEMVLKLQQVGNTLGSGGVGMTTQQAVAFGKKYRLLDYTTNSVITDPTGFNATLFEDKNNKWGQRRFSKNFNIH